MCRQIYEQELIESICKLHLNKAPKPNNFTIHFYRACWYIIKKGLIWMLNWTKGKDKIGGGTNSTFLVLITKDVNPSSFNRFQPISLCNASYKILTKIPANRIKPLLSNLIFENQRGFMPSRYILDNIILVQEAIHFRSTSGECGMVIKLDMSNDFDRVRHSYLFQVLKKNGFHLDLIRWVKTCIKVP